MKRKLKINAKLNLNLQVLGISGKYHILDSVMVAVDICDYLAISQRNDNKITVSGMDIDYTRNTAYKSALLFQQRYNTCGFDIDITKGIPMCSGLGGSSADGAGVLVALADMYGVDKCSSEFVQLCGEVGSDVAFMAGKQGVARLTDRGTQLQFTNYAKQLHFVVTTFGVDMSTAEVFARWDKTVNQVKSGDGTLFDSILKNQPIDSHLLVNDLQPVVESMSDYSHQYLKFIAKTDRHTCMTGSGSAYFVLCDSRNDAENLCCELLKSGFDSRVCNSCQCCVEMLSTQ